MKMKTTAGCDVVAALLLGVFYRSISYESHEGGFQHQQPGEREVTCLSMDETKVCSIYLLAFDFYVPTPTLSSLIV